jgi:hypothetical protein
MAKININMDSLKAKKEWVRHKIQDGINTFRFLPPFGEAANGYPYQKWFVIWGLLDPTTGKQRPFASPKTYEGKCPVFEYSDLLKDKAEQIKAALMQQGCSEEEIKERLSAINKFMGNIRPKSAYVWNAVDKSGILGVCELRSTAQKALKGLMHQYILDYSQDPTSLNSLDDDSGVWFNIEKNGKGLQTEYKVAKAQNKVRTATGKIAFEDDRSPLPENVVAEFNNVAYDLNTVYQKKTYDELLEILRANVTLLVQDNPDFAIDGFYYEEEAPAAATAPAPVAAPVQQSAAPKKVVTLQLGADDESDDEDISALPMASTRPQPATVARPVATIAATVVNKPTTSKPTAPISQSARASNNEDIMALAENIFNN